MVPWLLAAVARQMPVTTARRLQMQGAHPHLCRYIFGAAAKKLKIELKY
jgi:hypothetical protein